MKNIAYYNGVFAPMEEMKIPMNDRAIYFGDGVYEAMYVRNGKPFAMHDHLLRLDNSLRMARIPRPMPPEKLEELIFLAVSRVDALEQILYMQISRGTYPRCHAFPPADIPPNLLLFTREGRLADTSSRVKLRTEPDCRWAHCNVKTISMMPNVLAAQRAREEGCAETVFVRDGYVTECSSSGIFIITDGALQTAPLSGEILPSVTREHLLALAKALGMPVREAHFTYDKMLLSDEVFICSTSQHGQAAATVDKIPVGGRAPEALGALQQAYKGFVENDVGKL
ncbi:MAG: aminotransferase class IV [Clostridiales bacterium]|jgi:D-alanine transaminase|nr:aminotransferase class IV [Clostridiales bacterium]